MKSKHRIAIPYDVRQAVVDHFLLFLLLLGSLALSRGRITVEPQHHHHHTPASPSSLDSSVAFETTYVIPPNDHDSNPNKKVRFIVQRQPPAITLPPTISVTTTSQTNEMAQQQKTLSFVDAVNNKHLDLSTGRFSSTPSPFILSSTFSSSQSSSDRHPHTHFSSSSFSPPHTSITTGDNKNLSSSSSVNNHPPFPVGVDSTTNSTATITLKEAIDANILDAHSAYVVDTLEQR